MDAPPMSIIANSLGSACIIDSEVQRNMSERAIRLVKGVSNGVKKRRMVSARRAAGFRRRTVTQTGLDRKVKKLKRLIPNTDSSNGLDELFRNTAAYIVSLQMKIQVMQVMVGVLSSGSDHE